MAILKKRITADEAKRLLGGQWYVYEDGRPYARLPESIRVRPGHDSCYYRRNLCCWPELSQSDAVLAENHITLELIWPTEVMCDIDLANFYQGENGKFQHPMSGLQILELVKATGYPFSFPERVRAIPAARVKSHHLKLMVERPDTIIFIEPWSHYDDYNTSKYRTPEEAFKPMVNSEQVEVYQFTDTVAHIGCNIFFMPVGYNHEYCNWDCGTARERFRKEAGKWHDILQRFFNGECGTAEDHQDALTADVGQICKKIEQMAERAKSEDSSDSAPSKQYEIMDMSFEDWRGKLTDGWREKFLTPENLTKLRNSEVYVEEVEKGLRLWTVADPSSTTGEADKLTYEEYEQFEDIWYHAQKFIYCEAHYLPFMKYLSELYSTHDQVTRNTLAGQFRK